MITRRRALIGAALASASLWPIRAKGQDTMRPVSEFEWRYFQDDVMGGVSQGQALAEGAAIRLTGTVSTENNGGFIQVRTDLPDGLPPDVTAIHLRVRGNGERYFIHLRSRATRLPWQYYQMGFETGPNWSVVSLPLARFVPSARQLPRPIAAQDIRSLGLVAFGRDHRADVAVSALGWD